MRRVIGRVPEHRLKEWDSRREVLRKALQLALDEPTPEPNYAPRLELRPAPEGRQERSW